MIKNTALRLVGLSLIALMAGCSSMSGMKSDSAMAPGKNVVYASHNGTTVVYVPTASGVEAYSSDGKAECAQCKADTAAFSKGMKLSPVCSVCGANRTGMMADMK